MAVNGDSIFFIPFYHFNIGRTWFFIILGSLKLGDNGSKQRSKDSCLYAGFEEVNFRNEEENSWDGEME